LLNVFGPDIGAMPAVVEPFNTGLVFPGEFPSIWMSASAQSAAASFLRP